MTETPNINNALAELQTQLPRITKDLIAKVESKSTGAKYSYSYADLAQISEQVLPLLGKLGLSFVTRPTIQDGRFVLAYELRHGSGEQLPGVYPLPDRGTPQEIGSAITYARRYCLCAVTGVAPEGDDGDAVAAERAGRKQRQERPQQARQPVEPPMTAEQKTQMQDAFKALGLADRDAKLRFAIDVVERKLTSATELTQAEAAKVIDQARREAELPQPAPVEPAGTVEDWPPTAQPADGAA